MCIYIYTYTNIYIYIYIYTHTYIYIYIYIYKTYFEVDCNQRRAHKKFHVSTPFSLLADNGRKLIVTMTILNVTKKYELGKDKSYRCVANAVNISRPAQFVFYIFVIQGMFFNKHLDKVIFKFK